MITEDKDIEEFIIKYKNYIYKMGNKFFIPGAEREDLFQEGFIGLYKAIKNFKSNKLELNSYVSLQIRNSMLMAIRAANQKKRMILTRALHKEDINFAEYRWGDPERTFINKIELDNVYDFIKNNFTKIEKKVFFMKLWGYSLDEISSKLNKNKKDIGNALFRGKKKIMEFKQEKENE